MEQPKLFMLLVGCRPKGRHTEQHDTLFAIGNNIKSLLPQIKDFWPGAGTMHIDAWREVNTVNGYAIKIITADKPYINSNKLFFLNLGGYKENEFEEFHYKLITVAADKGEAIKIAKQTAFYKHTGFKGADSHIDDKYGIDVDDIYEINDILPTSLKDQYHIHISAAQNSSLSEDEMHLGYLKLSSL